MRKCVIPYVLLALFSACAQSEPPSDASENQAEQQATPREIIAAQKIKLGTIRLQALGESLRASGRIEAPPQSMATVQSPISALVSKVMVIQGQKVTRGEALVELQHPAILRLQQDYLQARALAGQRAAQLQRSRTLAEDKALSQKDLEIASADFAAARSRQASLEAELHQLGFNAAALNAENLRSVAVLRAPFSAGVQAVNAQIGMLAQPESPLLSLVSSAHLHLELKLSGDQVALVQKGQRVRFRSSTQRNYFFGEVYQVDALANAAGFFGAHVHYNDSAQVLLAGSFAQAEIRLRHDSVYALPSSALIAEEDNHYALALVGDQWEKIAVRVGRRSDSLVEIKNPGDLIGKELVLQRVRYLLAEEQEHEH